jgi:hypothetical protein
MTCNRNNLLTQWLREGLGDVNNHISMSSISLGA